MPKKLHDVKKVKSSTKKIPSHTSFTGMPKITRREEQVLEKEVKQEFKLSREEENRLEQNIRALYAKENALRYEPQAQKQEEEEEYIGRPVRRVERKRVPRGELRKPKSKLWFVSIISMVFLFFALSFLFSGATVNIVPKSAEKELSATFGAVSNAPSALLPFDIMVLSDEESKIVKGGEPEDVSIKATGRIILYNKTTTSQVLSEDTRLEGSNGKMYLLRERVTIPKGSGSAAGSIEAAIYASVAGEAYNSSPLDFKILGFKGTAKYTQIYGRSKGDISGGLVGKHSVISEEEKVKGEAELKQALLSKLVAKAREQIPVGVVLFDDAGMLKVDETTQVSGEGEGETTLKMKGTLTAFLFDEEKLSKKIAETVVEKYDGSPIKVENILGLKFSLINSTTDDAGEINNITFRLSGPAKVVWLIDKDKFKENILGKSKGEFPGILKNWKSVDSAVLHLTPLWKMSIPGKSDDIEIIVDEK